MAKLSQVQKLLASLRAERDVIDQMINKIELQLEESGKPAKKQPAVRKGRKLGSVLDDPTS